jgi:hypothetical protein
VPWDKIKDRDERYGHDTMENREIRKDIKLVEVHLDAGGCWKGG